MKVIIAGGRDFKDINFLREKCDEVLSDIPDVEIVSGKQVTVDSETGERYGADFLGEQYANERGFNVVQFPAKWGKHGRAAGPIRNREMAEYADMLIAFWDQRSRGTKSMISLARERGLYIKVFAYP